MARKKRILVVDDDDDLRMIVKETLDSDTYDVFDAANGRVALEMMKKSAFDLMITDLMMPGIKGVELVHLAKKQNPDMGALLMSAYGTIENAVEAMQEGAFDFITKPFSISHIESRVKRYFEYHELQKENRTLKKQLAHTQKENKIIGQSPAARDLLYHIQIVSKSDVPVFLNGESGTGKELIAQAIHSESIRHDKPFLKINCAAVPESLFESTLFGHEKGAFSGAYRAQKGIFEECDGGTLLLDEITEIPYSMQAKLLRVLQEMVVTRVGNTMEIPVDVRVIATTNRDIHQAIRDGVFREDLYFRLNVFPIEIAPLRERPEDIPGLVNHFLNIFKTKYKFDHKEIAPQLMEKMLSYPWPGNIRQLRHTLERAILLSANSELIDVQHFKLDPYKNLSSSKKSPQEETEVLSLAEMEKRMIYAALEKTQNHKTKAAELLGITVRTLRNKLHQFNDETADVDV